MYVTERSRSWSGDIRLRGGFELRCCLALSYLSVLKRFPIDKQDRNFNSPFLCVSKCTLILLAGWFPQITCRRHKVYTTTLFTLVFLVHSITDLLQQLYTAGKFYPRAKSLPRSVYKHGVIRTCKDIYLEMMVV